ncbi:hypothetical protein IMZ48_23940, partial [Candidatus Bathyarchaeota archaeon]|nr:hypothetical protein [Candidatus Bathyarchaeota archaeon]
MSPSPYAPDGTPLDPRNSLVLWGRPPEHVLRLAACVQAKLKEAAPRTSSHLSVSMTSSPRLVSGVLSPDVVDLWLMPPRRMHLTLLEIAHSKTPAEISAAVAPLRPNVRPLVDFTLSHRARLVRPVVSYDAGGVALSFLPAAGEAVVSPLPSPAGVRDDLEVVEGDGYTYHHLRRDVEGVLKTAGVGVQARYQVPSAHITLARYLGTEDHETLEQRRRWVDAVDEVNAWLEGE